MADSLFEVKTPVAGKRYLVKTLNSYGHEWTTIATYYPQYHKEDEGDYEGDCDYNEKNDLYYWPQGWYEYQITPDVNWMIHEKVIRFTEIPSF